MDTIRKLYVELYAKLHDLQRGQTMTEYALILAAVAVVVFVTYQVMGQGITNTVNRVNSSLATT